MTAVKKVKKERRTLSAIRYARVLSELGIARETVEEAFEAFEAVPELAEVLASPVVDGSQKHAAIDRIFPKEIRSFLKVAVDHGQAGIMEEIFQAYEEQRLRKEGTVTARLRFVTIPSKEQQERMEAYICKEFHGTRVQWEMEDDASLIGGFVLSVEGKEYDYSMQGQLARMEQQLIRR